MYRLGHTGIALLVLAPLSYGLLEAHKPLLALIIALGVLAVEPLPDFDFKLPFLNHRGSSHSLFAAVSIGGIIALCGWFVGAQVVTVLASVLSATSEVVTTVATSLESLASPETIGSIVAWIVGLLTEVVANLDWIVSQLQGLDRQTIAGVGFLIGAGGILVHLLGDVLTVSGIRPFLPFSDWKLSVSPLHAKSTLANTGFFAVGVLAVAVVLATTVAGIAVAPAQLSPIGIAAGQTTTQAANQTANHTATVELDSNNTTANTVVVSKVRLPEGGFIGVHDGAYAQAGLLRQSTVTVSKYFPPGVYRNVTIPVERGVPGISANTTRLNFTRTNLSVAVYQDTNNNTQYDFAATYGSTDTPYQTRDEPVVDTETVVIEQNVQQVNQRPQTDPVRVQFKNQQVSHVDGHPVLTVQNATLPKGGFVVIHDKRYLGETRDPLNSAIGISGYLTPGVHRNVTVRLVNGSVSETQTLVAVAYLDTDGDHRYDFVTTGGETDYSYVTRQNGSTVIVNDTATVRVPQSQQAQTDSSTPTPTTTSESSTVTPGAKSDRNGGLLADLPLLLIVALGAAFVAVVLLLLIGRGRGRGNNRR
jgi:membrane-bound metal-dependent hydrolase YbcI (DUF457 family)